MVSDAATASLYVTAFWTAVLMSGTNGSLIVPLVTSCPVIVMLARTVCVPAGTTSLLVVYAAEPASPTYSEVVILPCAGLGDVNSIRKLPPAAGGQSSKGSESTSQTPHTPPPPLSIFPPSLFFPYI